MQLSHSVLSLVALSIASVEALPIQQFSLKPFSQEALDQYNVLRFLGTAAPYVANPGYGIDREPPSQCKVTQANLIARHGERYPTTKRGKKMIESLASIRNSSAEDIDGPLAFLTDYEFRGLDEEQFDKESSSGPYSGLLELYKLGSLVRERYYDLYQEGDAINIYAASSERVVASAKKFTEGFLGENYNESFVKVIDEDDESLGANSLTPVASCNNYHKKQNDDTIDSLSDSYLSDIADRLNKESPGINVTADVVDTLMYYCGYDLNVDGSSEICDIFTTTEFQSYSYTKDVEYYYQKGPGNNMSSIIGSVYVNAVIELLKSSEEEHNLTLSFAHDSDLFYIISNLGLFDGDLSVEYHDFNHLWKVSDIAPMAARLIIERLECEGHDDDYMRIVLNDAVIPIPGNSDGPGFSLSVDNFEKYISERLDGHSYGEDCGLDSGVPTNLTFFWDN